MEFRVVADNFPSGPWVWEVEPLMLSTFNEASS